MLRSLSLSLLGLVISSSAVRGQELQSILDKTPSKANAVAYLNVPALGKLMSDSNMGRGLKAGVEEVWAVADLNTANLQPNWEAGYAKLKTPVKADALASALQGYVDKVDGKEAIWTPRQSYLVPLENGNLGFLRPAQRTLLASWVNSSGGTKTSEYLRKQAERPENFLSFLLAIDLENTFSPVAMKQRVGALATLEGQDASKIGSLLARVKGISIIVGRRNLGECILAVEFSQSPEMIKSLAPKLVSEILDRNGTAAPEVATWSPKVDGNTLMLQGPISEPSLDGVLSILSLKGHADGIASSVSKEDDRSEGNLVAYTTKKYFDDVNRFIERVRKYEAQTTGYRAKWNDQNARHIEELGTLNVDPEMVNYGASVASMLRGNAAAITKGNVAAGQLQAANQGNAGYGGEYYGGYYGGYSGYYGGGYSYQNAGRQNTAIAAQQRMGAFGSYKEAQSAIDELTAKTRREMTAKYNVQF